jgi:hypothetical protein
MKTLAQRAAARAPAFAARFSRDSSNLARIKEARVCAHAHNTQRGFASADRELRSRSPPCVTGA